MSEEDILKECTELAENEHHELGDCWDEEYSSSAIFGLIMLYKQEKEKNKELEDKQIWNKGRIEELKDELVQEKEKNKDLQKQLNGAFDRGFISKDKLKSFFQDKITYRQFELQQEYKDFKDDIKLNTLQNLKEEILKEK